MKPPALVLASASPRRAELLRQIGLTFSVRSADIDETPLANELPEDYVLRLALAKAEAVAKNLSHAVVLGSDTTVVSPAGEILGKPNGEDDAIRMLTALSGQTHSVLTSVAIIGEGKQCTAISRSQVRFRQLSAAEMLAYWHSGEPRGKAGGYAIQGLGAVFVAHLSGSYSAVMGLPLAETAALLGDFGMPVLAAR